ncbi:glycosyltransferase [Candidatus Nomurabacteria bacterium]|nr:glycosyltransferase [Candidatus Nomurabacteria bacterium]
MKVLMISTDSKIFEPLSEVRLRMISQAESFGKLTIAIIGKKSFLPQVINDKLTVFSLGRLESFFWCPMRDYELVTSQNPFEHGLIGWLWAGKINAKLQLQIHTDFLNPYFAQESLLNKIRLRLAKFLLPRADSVRVVSQRIADSLVGAGIRLRQKPVVQPVKIDLEKIKNEPIKIDLHDRYSQFKKIVLMASRLTREKNIDLAIRAMNSIIKSRPGTGLVIVGSGPEEGRLKQLVKQLKLEKNVFFESWTNNLSSFYKTADLFLLTSFYEGYGRTIVEAMACGCVVVSTDVGVAREVGAIISGDNITDLVETLEKIL